MSAKGVDPTESFLQNDFLCTKSRFLKELTPTEGVPAPRRKRSSQVSTEIIIRRSPQVDLRDQIRIFADPHFWLLGLAILGSGGAHVGYCFFIPKLAEFVLNLEASTGSLLISVLGVSNIFGR